MITNPRDSSVSSNWTELKPVSGYLREARANTVDLHARGIQSIAAMGAALAGQRYGRTPVA